MKFRSGTVLFHHGDKESRRKAKALKTKVTKDTKVCKTSQQSIAALTFAFSIDRMVAQPNSVAFASFVFDLGFGFPP
jgi:hypothetical protein